MKKLNNKLINTIAIILVFSIMLFLNFSITSMNRHDDGAFLKEFTNRYHSNYINYFRYRYFAWTSRSIIEFVLTFFVQHTLAWKIINSISMTIVAIMPIYIVKKKPHIGDILISYLLFSLIPINIIKETGWIATTTNYMWPMAAGLITIYPIIKYMRQQSGSVFLGIIGVLASFYANNQEQMVILLLLFFSICVWILLRQKRSIQFLLPFLIINVISLIYILTCPGNSARVLVETKHFLPDFSDYSFLFKVYLGYTTTLTHLFYEPDPFIALFSLSIMAMGFSRAKNYWEIIISTLPMITYAINQFLLASVHHNYNLSNGNWQLGLTLQVSIVAIIYIGSLWITCQKEPYFYLIIGLMLAGLGIRMILGFSPTLWASGNRTYLFTYVLFIMAALINITNQKESDLKTPIFGYVVALTFVYCILWGSISS